MAKSTKVTKITRKRAAAARLPEQLTDNLTAAGRNVWLASLGAVAAVGTESSNLFDSLVEKGRTREKTLPSWPQPSVSRLFEETGDRLGKLGGRVEKLVQERTTAVLHSIGVPSRDEIRLLIKRVEQLNAKVEYIASNRANALPN